METVTHPIKRLTRVAFCAIIDSSATDSGNTVNERIRQLAEQAGIAIYGDAVYMYHPKDTLDSSVLSKFAESIVNECITQIAMIGISNFENNEYGDIGWTVDTSIEMIKDHFGVAE
jgi:hypothetical protein